MALPSPTVAVFTQAVAAQFADRPTLRGVVSQMLRDSILRKYPPLDLDPVHVRLAEPGINGGWLLHPFLDKALAFMASGETVDFSKKYDSAWYLSHAETPAKMIKLPSGSPVDMAHIESAVRELQTEVFIAFQEALADFWQQPGDTGTSRWQWLGDLLRNALRTSALRQTDLSAAHRAMLNQLLAHPDNHERVSLPPEGDPVHAYTLETTLTRANTRVTVQEVDILLVKNSHVLLCRVDSKIEPYASLDAFGQTWGQTLERRYDAGSIVWKRFEPDGNIFDTQAALLLNQQLEDLALIKPLAGESVAQLEQRYAAVTDLVPRLADLPTLPAEQGRRMKTSLPDWLGTITAEQRFTYLQHLIELANVKKTTEGRHYLDGITDLHTYAAEALQKQMQLDHPRSPPYKADELKLTFAVAVGILEGGYVTRVSMTLTELAVKNLAGKPKGQMSIQHTGEQSIEHWLDPTYVETLVQSVDIGRNYPKWLKDQLLGVTDDARRREQLFAAQMNVQLPLQAVELWTRQQSGFTRQGYRYVAAVVKLTCADRQVDGQEIVMRPLAFLRKPGAKPDTVADMFLIEPREPHTGTVVLYRPQHLQTLMEFASSEALLEAIAQPGDLQQSVLTWLSNGARAIYDHGGFREPHLQRFIGVGDEAAPLLKPAPAALARDESASELLQFLDTGRLMEYLYGSYTRTLVELGNRESTSNAESRWAVIMEGTWLLFNTVLLPLLRGPAMLAGWMLQISASLINDIPALSSSDPTAKEAAWIDLLMNLGLVLLHGATHLKLPATGENRSRLALTTLRRRASALAHAPARIEQSSVGLPSEPPGSGKTLIDFNLSTARGGSTERLFQQLLDLKVPWPENLPEPVAVGPFKGLYRIGDLWHASVRGRLFQVTIVSGFGEVFIVHPKLARRGGVKLKTDGRGRWDLDEGLKLEGGGRDQRRQQLRTTTRARLEELNGEKAVIVARLKPLDTAETNAQTRLNSARTDFEAQQSALALAYTERQAARGTGIKPATARHAAQLEKTQTSLRALRIAFEVLKRTFTNALPVRQELVSNLNQAIALDNTPSLVKERGSAAMDIAKRQFEIRNEVRKQGQNRKISTQGEEIDALKHRMGRDMNVGNVASYFEYVDYEQDQLRQMDALIDETNTLETIWEEMSQRSAAEKASVDKAIGNIHQPELFFSRNLKLHRIESLRELSINRSAGGMSDAVAYTGKALLAPDLDLAIASHMEVQSSRGYSIEERIDVLETVTRQYERSMDLARALQQTDERFHRPAYLTRLLESLGQAHTSAQDELGALINESQAIPAQSVSRPSFMRRKPSSKRVIKTRDSGWLVGDIARDGSDLVEVSDDFSGKVLGTFHQHVEEDLYVEVKTAPPPAGPTPAQRPAATLRHIGRALVEDSQKLMQEVARQVQQALSDPVLLESKVPADWEHMLDQKAGSLDALAEELKTASAQSDESRPEIESLQHQAKALREAGERHRADIYKKQRPTFDKLYWLKMHGFVDIVPVFRRRLVGPRDYLTEFAIKDAHNQQDLWFAHFHYSSDIGADAAAGHLKSVAQKNLGLNTQLRQAASSQEVTWIWRGRFSAQASERLFFPTANVD